MSQDIVADALNMMRNAVKARKETLEIKRISGLLIEILKIMKQKGAIRKYKIDSKNKAVEIEIEKMFECRAIKPRFTVKKDQIERYRRRFLPARDIGTIIISTNKGLITHEEALEKGIGGSLLAYFY
ncbi:MAG: 30S ribosomal protein S8 [Candidatus Pacearchaeota archaeon]|nr:30S ribosomal protein S8 [Candidatus Pacearchaeota archaeon]